VRKTRFGGGPALAAALATMIVASACGGATPATTSADTAQPGLTTTWDGVTLAAGSTVVPGADLLGTDDDGTLRFASGSAAAKAANPGEVLVVEGDLVRKVVSVSESNGEVVVATEEASLGELIENGRVGWDYAVDWGQLPDSTYTAAAAGSGLEPTLVASTSNVPPRGLLGTSAASRSLAYVGTVQGFAVEARFTPSAGRLDFTMTAKRANVKLDAKGFLTGFTQSAEIEYRDSVAQSFETSVSGLKGEAELKWAAYQTATDPGLNTTVMGIELPLQLAIPFTVGTVPMTMTVKMNFRVVPALEALQASSGGSFKLTYDAEQGFTSKSGTATPTGSVKAFDADLGSTPTVSAGMGPVGFGFGLEFPRFELAVGTPLSQKFINPFAFITLNQYVNGMWTPGTTLTADIPPCQRASLKVSAIAGYRLTVLGMVEVGQKSTLWEKNLDKFLNDKPCTLTGE
jgi:hypothetical protein